VDDENISGVFVTVAEVKVDGKAYSGFENKLTINLMNYQNGNTKILGMGNLDIGSHNIFTLVIE
jgi:hypothetical protein